MEIFLVYKKLFFQKYALNIFIMSSPFCTPTKKSPKPERILARLGNMERQFAGHTPHNLKLIAYSPTDAPLEQRVEHNLVSDPDVRIRLDFSDEGLLHLGRPITLLSAGRRVYFTRYLINDEVVEEHY
jgi:hypothetical protein